MKRPKTLRPREVFISHAHQDWAFVAKLTKTLQRHHIKYWYSPKHIVGAQQWHDEIVHTAPAPVPVRCGFAVVQDAVYFGSGAELWRYRLPKPVSALDPER